MEGQWWERDGISTPRPSVQHTLDGAVESQALLQEEVGSCLLGLGLRAPSRDGSSQGQRPGSALKLWMGKGEFHPQSVSA